MHIFSSRKKEDILECYKFGTLFELSNFLNVLFAFRGTITDLIKKQDIKRKNMIQGEVVSSMQKA